MTQQHYEGDGAGESDELQRPPDEEEKGMETVPEDAPEKEAESPVEDDDSAMVTAEELKEEFSAIGSRVKTAGLKPFRKMVRAYADNLVGAIDDMLSALEGNKRKKGD